MPKPRYVCIKSFVEGIVFFVGEDQYEMTAFTKDNKSQQIKVKAKPIKQKVFKKRSICLWIERSKDCIGENLYDIVQSVGL